MRIVINGNFFRRNVSTANVSLPGSDRDVPGGGFITYAASDVHMNPKIYTDPEVFDPERFSPGREEDKRSPYAFLAWGVGE
jgi:cytochrome P450